jgi:hypothetical protein
MMDAWYVLRALKAALPKKSVLLLLCCRYNDLILSIILSILNFWAKPLKAEEISIEDAKKQLTQPQEY